MKNLILYIVITTIFLQMTACIKYFKDDELSLERRDYNGDELKIDGYYYQTYGNYLSIYFLYRNGTIMYWGGGYSVNEIEQLENEFLNSYYIKSAQDDKTRWGVFQIKEDSIKFEKWYPRFPAGTAMRSGNILNDTTFIIIETYKMVDGEKTQFKELNEIYHFKKFSPKPDSTQSFIP